LLPGSHLQIRAKRVKIQAVPGNISGPVVSNILGLLPPALSAAGFGGRRTGWNCCGAAQVKQRGGSAWLIWRAR